MTSSHVSFSPKEEKEAPFSAGELAFRAPLSRRLVLPFLLGGLVLVGLFLLGGFVLISNPWGKKVAAPSEPIPVEESRLRAHVLALTQTSQPRNPEHPLGLEEAARYIEGQWKSWGLSVESQRYKVAGQSYRNLLTYVGPAKGPRLIVGAHYDVCGDQPGADDNASAVAGLLELSRLLQQQKPPLPLRVDLVAYTVIQNL